MNPRVNELRELYDTAFRDWSAETKRLHDLRVADGDGADISGAEIRATAAESAYRETRDQLAAEVAKAACACA